MKKILLSILFVLLSSPVWAATPAIFYSDLTAGPNTGGENNNGVYVTIWGAGLGATQGTSTITVGGGAVANVKTWTTYTRFGSTFEMICFQLGSSAVTGNIVITVGGVASNGLPFTVQSGSIWFYQPGAATNGSGTYTSPFNNIYYAYNAASAGDTIYIRAGTIQHQSNGRSGYHSFMCEDKGGTSGHQVSYIAYPNETVTIGIDGAADTSYNGGASNGDTVQYGFRAYASYVTVAKLSFQGTGVTGNIQSLIAQGTGWRSVGNSLTTVTYNYAILSLSGASSYVLGNEIYNSGTGLSGTQNVDHSIYIDGPTSPFEVGWNYDHNNVQMGWDISSYHNGNRSGLIHDNITAYTTAGDGKGILVGGAFDSGDTLSTTFGNVHKVYNNQLYNAGQSSNGGAIQIVCGTTYLDNNTIYGSGLEQKGMVQEGDASCGPGGGNTVVYMANNILYGTVSGLYISDGNGNPPANWSDFAILANNNYYGEGNGPTQDTTAINADPKFVTNFTDLHIQSTSPDKAPAGYNTSAIVPTDFDGNPSSSSMWVGAYTYVSGACLVNGTVCSSSPTCCSGLCLASVCVNPAPNVPVINMSLYGKTELIGRNNY